MVPLNLSQSEAVRFSFRACFIRNTRPVPVSNSATQELAEHDPDARLTTARNSGGKNFRIGHKGDRPGASLLSAEERQRIATADYVRKRDKSISLRYSCCAMAAELERGTRHGSAVAAPRNRPSISDSVAHRQGIDTKHSILCIHESKLGIVPKSNSQIDLRANIPVTTARTTGSMVSKPSTILIIQQYPSCETTHYVHSNSLPGCTTAPPSCHRSKAPIIPKLSSIEFH